jgi:hypothetical protein
MSTLEYIPLPFQSTFSLHVPCNVFASLDLLSKKHLGNSLTMEFVFFTPTTPFVWLFFLFFCCSFVGARTMWSLDSPSGGQQRKLKMVWTCSRVNIFFKALSNDVDLICILNSFCSKFNYHTRWQKLIGPCDKIMFHLKWMIKIKLIFLKFTYVDDKIRIIHPWRFYHPRA